MKLTVKLLALAALPAAQYEFTDAGNTFVDRVSTSMDSYCAESG